MRIKPEVRNGRKTGKFQLTLEDKERNIPRTRRVFDSRKEAEEWAAHVKKQAQDLQYGRRPTRTFGEAFARYLTEIIPGKKSGSAEAAHHLITLRWPFLHDGHYIRLEDVPLESSPGQLAIAQAMASWCADQKAVVRRSRLHGLHYQKRKTARGEFWFVQYNSLNANDPPPPRMQIQDPAIIAQLDAAPGAGPYRPDTLRIRQAAVKTILKLCWQWDWTSADLSTKIKAEAPAAGREFFATQEQRWRLMMAARKTSYGRHFAHAIWAATTIGFRRYNILDMTWEQVVPATGRQPGVVWVRSSSSKTGKPLVMPIHPGLQRLLDRRAKLQNGPLIFHRGDGQPFGDFRKAWKACCKAAGFPPGFRWHDLRHTWASLTIQGGGDERQLTELAGWTTTAMAKRYAHLRVEHLINIAAIASKGK